MRQSISLSHLKTMESACVVKRIGIMGRGLVYREHCTGDVARRSWEKREERMQRTRGEERRSDVTAIPSVLSFNFKRLTFFFAVKAKERGEREGLAEGGFKSTTTSAQV
jgi:hypothetical protein